MPQVDLEAFVVVCRVGSSGGRIACEPLDHNVVEKLADSFLLSKHAEFDWLDRNAILERKDSSKRIMVKRNNSKSSSQRFSKSKAGIIGLPRTQKSHFFDMRRCKPTNVRLFPPKRSESVERSRAQMNEPSSPKVSCVGRVRSKRSRRRRPETRHAKAEEKIKSRKKKGFCANLLSLFGLDRGDRSVVKNCELSVTSKKKTRENIESTEAVMMPPALGGMTRFASGRRSYQTDEGDGDR